MDKEKFDLERWVIAENLSKNFHINGEGWDASDFEWAAHCLQMDGYRRASEVALEAIDDFQRTIRHIFLDMCNGNDYNTLNLLQIDSAIEALFDSRIAELKKKYESEKDNGKM